MAGRHSAPPGGRRSRALPSVLVLLAAVILAWGAFALVGNASNDEASACEGTVDVTVSAAPEISPVLSAAARQLEGDETTVRGACVDYDVKAAPPERVEELLVAESAAGPDLWVPDFSVWVRRAELSGVATETVAESVATTPVVVVGPDGKAPSAWQEVGMNTVAYLDPLKSSASTAALLSAFGEMEVTGASEVEMGSMMVPLAQRYGGQPDKPETVEDVAAAAQQGGLGVMTEQQLVALQKDGTATELSATIPESGTMFLDHPLVALSPDEDTRAAARRLATFLEGEEGAELLATHGFRGTDRAPLPSGDGLGKGPVPALPLPKAQQVVGAMRQWAVLTVPSRMLAVVDVSGSMDFTDDAGRTRISLAVTAAQSALRLFPDNAKIGLWAFSVDRGPGNRDYTAMVPVRALGSEPGGEPQRDALAKALRRLPRMTDGGTGLYDTTLAAIRTLQEDYDPRAVNTVILLTDGENEDPGSLRLPELVDTIEREQDPARPVHVIAIGMGPEADAKALKRIAAATGGRSYVARDPADIGEVFIDAMLSR